METIFTHTPTKEILEQVGIPEVTEADYLARVTKEDGDDKQITVLNDLSHFFSLIQNDVEVTRIETELEKSGAFTPGFNE